MPVTPNYSLRYPSLSSAPNVPQDLQFLATDADTVVKALADSLGVWTSFTPTLWSIVNGARVSIGKTVVYAKYLKVGKTVWATADVTATANSSQGAGLSMPFAAGVRQVVIGSCAIMNGAAPTQASLAIMAASLDAVLATSLTAAPNDIVSGQSYRYSICYEAA